MVQLPFQLIQNGFARVGPRNRSIPDREACRPGFRIQVGKPFGFFLPREVEFLSSLRFFRNIVFITILQTLTSQGFFVNSFSKLSDPSYLLFFTIDVLSYTCSLGSEMLFSDVICLTCTASGRSCAQAD